MEKTNILNKRKVIICCLVVLIVVFLVISIIYTPKEVNGINAVVVVEDSKLYSDPIEAAKKMKLSFTENAEVTILESIISEDKEWYLVQFGKKRGYILAQNVDYYKKDKAVQIFVSDFSSFDFKSTFKSKKYIEAFLVKNDVSYVYIRAGGRGYGEKGNFYTDEKYKEIQSACEYLGIQYGYYFLDEALTDKEIIEEVKFIDDFMKNNKTDLCTLPIALDIESHDGKGRCDNIWDNRAEIVKKLLKNLDSVGYETIVYSNAKTCNDYLSKLDTKFWLAYYPEENFIPDYWYTKTSQAGASNSEISKKMIGWQFTENGVKHVIKEKVDFSIFKSDFFENE